MNRLDRTESTTHLDPKRSLEAAGKEAAEWTDDGRKQWQRHWMKDERIGGHRLPVTTNLNTMHTHAIFTLFVQINASLPVQSFIVI